MSEEKDVALIPYYVHEGEMSRLEIINKRLWISLFVVFAAFVLSNFAWIIYENQFEDVVTTETYTADANGGGTAVANGEGDVTVYGNSGLHPDSQSSGSQNE